MSSTDNSRLLALPFEVRQIILRDLLRRPECNERLPCHLGDRPPKLCPAILSTCRQLCAEGLPLLYSHVLHFDIFASNANRPNGGTGRNKYDFQPIYLGRMFAPSNIPPAIAQRASHINIQVHCRRVDGIYLLATIQDPVRKVRKLVAQHAHWQHLTVRAYTTSSAPLNEAHVLQPLALQPFRPLTALRGRSSVVCDGVDPHFAAELAWNVTSTVPVGDNVDDMYEELEAVLAALAPAKPKPFAARTESDFGAIWFTQQHDKLRFMALNWVEPRRDHGDLLGFVAARLRVLRGLRSLLGKNQRDGETVQTIQGDPVWLGEEIDRLLAHDEGYGVAPASTHG